MKTTPRFYRVVLTLLFFTGFLSQSFSQRISRCDYHRPRQADQWRFGDDAGIDFRNLDSPKVVNGDFFGNNTEFTPGGVSTIASEDGELLLYSNGLTIWNKGFYVMKNGGGLAGNNGSTMSSLIVPAPGKDNQFYVFTVDMYFPDFFEDGIRYNIADLSVSSYGEVTKRDVQFMTENTQKIAAVKHKNGRDYWIITHGFGKNKGDSFYVYLLSDSLNTNPVVSKVGLPEDYVENDFQTFNNEAGYMVASSDGSMIAQVVNYDGYVELFDFDNATGKLSNARNTTPGNIVGPYGVAFSADSKKLYVTTSPLDNSANILYQFDLSQSNALDNPVVIESMYVTPIEQVLFGALQLATDGKIYVSKFIKGLPDNPKYNSLGVIYNPDRPGLACNYNQIVGVGDKEFQLGNGNSYTGLPTFPNNFLDIPHFWSYHQCHHDTTNFIIRNTANINSATWNLQTVDPDGEEVTSGLSPEYVFSKPGKYGIELTEEFNGNQYNFSDSITIFPLPPVQLASSDTLYLLPNSSIKLDAGDYDYYFWSDGSFERYLNVASEGLYSVTVIDTNCCENADTVYVKYANLFFPNAINPSSSFEVNKKFKVLGPIQSIAEYNLMVFDRWGKMLFTTDDVTEGWDATYKGAEVPAGVYAYKAVMKSFASDIKEAVTLKQSGTVMVVR